MNYAPELPNVIHVRLSDQTWDRLAAETRASRNSISATVRHILNGWLDAHPLPKKRRGVRPRSEQGSK